MTHTRKYLFLLTTIALIAGSGFRSNAQLPRQAVPPTAVLSAPSEGVSFDVASVRQSLPDAPTVGQSFVTAFHDRNPEGGLFRANLPLFAYVIFAYKVVDASQYTSLAEQLPNWAQTERFTIEARADGTPSKDQLRLMTRSLLEQRFKLAAHTETRQLPAYGLILDKTGKWGPRLQFHADVPCPDPARKPALSTSTLSPCGGDGWPINGQWRSNGRLHIRMADATMDEIASYLGASEDYLGEADHRSILNETGLKGRFDMEIEFARDQSSAALPDAQTLTDTTFTEALKEQLGLKLRKQIAPVDVLVIDHVEKPSTN